MRVRLMTDVPDQPVVGGIEDVMQGNGQFDDTKAGAKMAARLANGIKQLQAQFISQGFKLCFT